jgi:hypothetical protein
MYARRTATLIAIILVASACSGRTAAENTCLAHPYNPPTELVGAFEADASDVYARTSGDISAPRHDPDERAVFCYVDGEFPKGPPPGSELGPPDRALYAVIGDDVIPIKLGYRDSMPVVEP